jgi:hypothetical protein
MNISMYPQGGAHCVVVSGPRHDDAKFASEWLQAAAEADRLLQTHLSSDANFEQNCLDDGYPINFSAAALEFISLWRVGGGVFLLECDLSPELLEHLFCVMTQVGFFVSGGDYYRMAVPKDLNAETIRRAVLIVNATEELDGCLHLERLLNTMTAEKAKKLAMRLFQERFPRTRTRSSN